MSKRIRNTNDFMMFGVESLTIKPIQTPMPVIAKDYILHEFEVELKNIYHVQVPGKSQFTGSNMHDLLSEMLTGFLKREEVEIFALEEVMPYIITGYKRWTAIEEGSTRQQANVKMIVANIEPVRSDFQHNVQRFHDATMRRIEHRSRLVEVETYRHFHLVECQVREHVKGMWHAH